MKPASLELLVKVTQLKTSKSETMCDIDVVVIPGGLTPLVQPLDVSINRPFKQQTLVGALDDSRRSLPVAAVVSQPRRFLYNGS